MQLRWYQRDAIDAVYAHLRAREDNPCVVMPTGSGKSPTIAQIARDTTLRWGGRCLILAHRKELLEQNADKLRAFEPDLDIGIYSAGLSRRDTEAPVIFAGIQSVYQRATQIGKFDLILVDEAHLIPADGEGMYQTLLTRLLELNREARVIGFTATPFRTRTGEICTKDGILNHVCYEISPVALIAHGFLANLTCYAGEEEGRIDVIDVAVSGGEFVRGQVELKALVDGRVAAATKDIVKKTVDRKKVLVFTASVKHCELVFLELTYLVGRGVAWVTGDTPTHERDQVVKDFRDGKLKYLLNVEVFTEGLDVPSCDCIVLLRPTKSPGLFVQMVGRGFRVAPGKKNCLILDYGDNVLRHGPVDRVTARVPGKRKGEAPAKECPDCHALIAAGFSACPQCGHVFPKPEPLINPTAAGGTILGPRQPIWVDVDRVEYHVHEKFGAPPDAPKTVRVEYTSGIYYRICEWLCVEHEGFAQTKARKWWGARQRLGSRVPMPESAAYAVEILRGGAMREAGRILVLEKYGRERFDVIRDYELRLHDGSLLSELNAPTPRPEIAEEELPF